MRLSGLKTANFLWQNFVCIITNIDNVTTLFFYFLNYLNMGNILYTIAVILIIIWAISFLGGFFTGGIIHILLVIAVIAIIYNLLTGRKTL